MCSISLLTWLLSNKILDTGAYTNTLPFPRRMLVHNGRFRIMSSLHASSKVDHDREKRMKEESNSARDMMGLGIGTLGKGDATSFSTMREAFSSPKVEVQMAILVLLSCFVAALGTLQNLPTALSDGIIFVENIYSVIFSFEYFVRWYLSGFSAKHFFQPLVIIDLIAISPSLFQVVSMMGFPAPAMAGTTLITLRLFRILRLQRVLNDYDTFKKFELALGLQPSKIKPYQLELARVLSTVFTLLSIASGLIYSAEHEVNPGIPDYFTALYFGLTTLTTVGFGDIVPITTEGKLVVSGSILFGVTIIPAQAAALADALLNRQKEGNEKLMLDRRENDDTPTHIELHRTCMSCGISPHRSDAMFCWGCGTPLQRIPSSPISSTANASLYHKMVTRNLTNSTNEGLSGENYDFIIIKKK